MKKLLLLIVLSIALVTYFSIEIMYGWVVIFFTLLTVILAWSIGGIIMRSQSERKQKQQLLLTVGLAIVLLLGCTNLPLKIVFRYYEGQFDALATRVSNGEELELPVHLGPFKIIGSGVRSGSNAPYLMTNTDPYEINAFVKEPFVGGVPEILNALVADIPNAKTGFRLTFSARAFPGHEIEAVRGEASNGGYWYRIKGTGQDGWLCPAMFKYFDEAPERIFVKADAIIQ